MDEIEEVQQHNMISNLPLLFANGYPTALEKITESQLENFIPFMVQCSLGHINLQGKIDYSEPEWWPENVAYTIPFTKPKKFTGNWLEKMKEIVVICYQFHKSVFLLRFCNDLAAYEHASLRFINNYNSTTSLFDRRSNKLLVTFRNENMSYDQPQRIRKCLLQQKSKLNSQQQQMVEPAPFDIYLCDNCDAELYSEEAIVEHEKTCNLDDDVIICDSPEPIEEDNQINLSSSNTTENNELRIGFLLNFNLQCRESGHTSTTSTTTPSKDPSSSLNVGSSKNATKEVAPSTPGAAMEKLKRLPRRNRAVHSLSRCPTIALSSPAGQLLIKTSKTLMTQDYLMERLDRMERFCYAPTLAKGANKPKFFDKKYIAPITHCTFKKPPDYTIHTYMFPRRQFSQRQRTENFMFLNSLLIKRCRPISVRLRKITHKEMIKRKRANYSNKLNIKLTRDTSRSSNWKISSPSAQIIVDTIDLCSSGDEGEQHPAKIMRGNTPDSSSSSSGRSHFKPQVLSLTQQVIKTFPHRLNSEITLTPIPREPLKGYSLVGPSVRQSLPAVVAAATSTTHPINKSGYPMHRLTKKEEDKPLTPSPSPSPIKRYEGNILLSPTTQNGGGGGGVQTGIIATKPLQPSVFIFSNYTTTPISINSFLTPPAAQNTGATTVATINNNNNNNDLVVSSSYQNEENHHETSSRTKNKNSDWYPASIAANNLTISSTLNSSSNSVSKAVSGGGSSSGSERSSRSLPLLPFGTASRVISIDLTS
ncbi:uncharacterized protein LOC129949712 [Eupeodes corollae]|uniref:uncharacterized protein LOC129949712 n=1 Tax=Eupeodes corollae TaxID=290404 RepID=UPI002491B49E|nr:uncharacterized protein LOC129949712 [Eupeodes corollae]XP_055917315.1 uncharacterized protein LOC129949712 [Eupeodes corollae]